MLLEAFLTSQGQCDPCNLFARPQALGLCCQIPGDGLRSARITLVGEGLGEQEEDRGLPFQGRAGEILNLALKNIELSRTTIWITNSVRCRPVNDAGKNRKPTDKEIGYCAGWLDAELAANANAWKAEDGQGYRVIVAMGKTAIDAVLQDDAPTGGVILNQGQVIWSNRFECWVVCTLHPAYVLRKLSELQWLQDDLQRAVTISESGWSPSLPEFPYEVVRTREQADAARDAILQWDRFAFDWETDGLHLTKARGFCLAVSDGRMTYVFPRYGQYRTPIWSKPDLQYLDRSVLTPILVSAGAKGGAHVAFDCSIAKSTLDIWPTNIQFDVIIGSHTTDNHLSERSHGLKRLAGRLLGIPRYDDELDKWLVTNEYVKSNGEADRGFMHCVPNEMLWQYAATDAWITYRLDDEKIRPRLIEQNVYQTYIEERIPLAVAYGEIDRTGVFINTTKTEQLADDLETVFNTVCEELERIAGHEVNPNSPQQVANWLFTERGLPVMGKTETGAPSTKEELLLQLADQEPTIGLILHGRAYTKLRGFDEGLSLVVDEDQHARLNNVLIATETFRLATRKPFAIHTIPRPLSFYSCDVHGKYNRLVELGSEYKFPPCCALAFKQVCNLRGAIEPDPGYGMLQADFKQQEYVIMAIASGQADLEEALLDRDEDAHEFVLELLSGKRKDQYFDLVNGLWIPKSDSAAAEYKNLRSRFKQVNFMILYRGGYKKLARSLKIDDSDASRIIDEYYDRLPKVKWWQYQTIKDVRANGRVTGLFGTYRILPGIYSKDKFEQFEAERQACNFPIQNGGAHVMFRAILRLRQTWTKRGKGPAASRAAFPGRVLFSVHDELIAQARLDLMAQANYDIVKAMTGPHPQLIGGCGIERGIKVDIKETVCWDGAGIIRP